MSATFTYHDWDAPGTYEEQKRTIEVVYTRRDVGGFIQGWYVCRADNKRILGWAIGPKEAGSRKTWIAYAADGAFKGDSIDDEGDSMDRVPADLTKRGDGYHVIEGGTRDQVTQTLIHELAREHATALGFGRHYRVQRAYENRPKLRAWFADGMQGDWPDEED